jgi:uncharacterized protein YigE (DUF2233 family)
MKTIVLLVLASLVTLCAEVHEERVEFVGVKFRVVRVTPEQLQVVWKDDQGVPYRTFDRVQTAFAQRHHSVKFLMNAGIFEPGGIPCGVHVENGKTLHALNLADAPGNFFLKPNGVVWIEKGGTHRNACIGPSENFQRRAAELHLMSSRWLESAVQSGPLLLIDGHRHPAFKAGSPNKLHRNGVGVNTQGRVVFAITEPGQLVNLWDFAGLFLKLGCQNALFLDGDISQMAVNPPKPLESNQFGAMFVVTE